MISSAKRLRHERLLELLKTSAGLSSASIARHFGVTRITAYSDLKYLIAQNRIEAIGKGKAARYFLADRRGSVLALSEREELISMTLAIMMESGLDIEIFPSRDTLGAFMENWWCYSTSGGELFYGLDGFVLWCREKRSLNEVSLIAELLTDYLVQVLTVSWRRRGDGMFEGTKSLQSILASDTRIIIQKLLFCEVANFGGGFPPSRWALELRLAKQHSDAFLYQKVLQPELSKITEYIKKYTVDAMIFTPPTNARPLQFSQILEQLLKGFTSLPQQIVVQKIQKPGFTPRAQKELKGHDRIINAQSVHTIMSDPQEWLDSQHILILDDNFTTGATVNGVADLCRRAGFAGKISAICITGSFHYDSTVVGEEEV